MNNKQKIQVHRMDDWFSGVYIKPMGAGVSRPGYDHSVPHRHDFCYCVLMDKGNMELRVDFRDFQLSDETFFLSYPGQIHQIQSAQLSKGWFIAFDPSFLEEQLRDVLDQCLSEVIMLQFTPEQSSGFFLFVNQLYAVYSNQAHLFRENISRSMVNALVYQLTAAYLSVERSNLQKLPLRSVEITKSFKQLLRRNFKTIKRPSAFASGLNMTLNHLNDTVKSVTGFSVTHHIQQELMMEAQRLLYYTDDTIMEIADHLGYEDEKYFSRLFHKITGVAPTAFRKSGSTIYRL